MGVLGPMRLRVEIERWPVVTPFRITGYTWTEVETLLVTLERSGLQGRGEAGGVYYRNETAASMVQQIESVRAVVESGITRESLLAVLPTGGARNALDCALWDLESQLSGRPVWQLAGLQQPRPLWATYTCSADDPEKMAAAARSYVGAKAIKLKLTGEAADAARVEAVREARPDVVLRVDANQGFTPATLEALMPVLTAARVTLVEQPFRIGQDALLEGFESPIALAADESVQCLADIAPLVGRVSMINIKLDKCGGLTEALSMARAAQGLGLDTMVGNMLGTSLAMAPGFLLGQLCKFVELDAPIALSADRTPAARFLDGFITCPESLWGYPRDCGASPQVGG